jgi:hypothetical protein
MELAGCVEVRLHTRVAILTLVGEGIDGTPEFAARAFAALKQIPATFLSSSRSKLAVSLMVPSAELQRSVEMLHREFFQHLDPAVFAECQDLGAESPQPALAVNEAGDRAAGTARRFAPLTTVCQN